MQAKDSPHSLHIILEDGEITIDAAPEERFDRLTRIAKHTFNVPIALICLKKGKQRLWLKSSQGLPLQNATPCEQLFCNAALSNRDELLYIPDTLVNDHFCDHPCVNGESPIRFYAGAAITLAKQRVGTLCIIDHQARTLSADDLAVLSDLARCVETELKHIQKKQLVQQFRKQRKHLSAVLDTIVDGILTIDSQGIIETVNKATLAIFGYTPQEMLGNNVNMLMPEPFHSAHNNYLSNYLTTQHAKVIGIGREVVGLRKNGEMFPMSLAVGVMESNHQKHFVGIVRDITPQKKDQQALEQFKYMLDHTVDCVFTCRVDNFRLTYINKAAKRQVGYSEAELLRLSIADIKPEFTRERYRQLIAPLLSGERESQTFETVHRHKNGSEIPVEVTQQIIRQAQQEPRLLTIVRDISERKAVERMKSQFVSTVSHELRTPLTSIRGALGLVLGGALGEIPEKAQSILLMANRNSERLSLLINDLLDLERIESAQMVFAFQTVDLIKIVRDAIDSNQSYPDPYGVSLQLYVSHQRAWVNADENRLLQVLANLLSNAIKFSHAGGTVKLTVLRQEGNYKVLVQDQGDGIPHAFRARIFDRFAQADSADNRQKGGSGLGLSISKAIVERHQGNIGFDSSVGVGTTFAFSLPLTKVVDTAMQPQCILLCKNDTTASKNLIELLQQEGFSYDVTTNIDEAKRLLNCNKYTLMVLDLALPEPSSMAFISELPCLTNANELSIIITSLADNDGQTGDVLLARHLPITRDRLHSALQLALSGHRRAKILHVEDDLDIIRWVKNVLSDTAMNYHSATSLGAARRFLNSHDVDLVILDMTLPDGSGMELLPEIQDRCQVVIFSGHDMRGAFSKQVAAVLMKSITNNEQLLATIHRVLNTN